MSAWRRVNGFLRHDLWQVDLAELAPFTRIGVRLLRFLVVVAWEFRAANLSLRATGLVYTTLLTLVPFLAVAFSILKAFGAHQQLEPLLLRAFEPLGEQGDDVARQVIGFVDNMRVGVLGTVGLAGLLFTVISVLEKVEDALNHVWRVRRSRPMGRKVTDYLTMALVGPVLVFSALALTASGESHWAMRRLPGIGPVAAYLVPLAERTLPVLFVCLAFTLLFKFLPNTRVHLSSALVGGATAAVLWQVAGQAFTAFIARSPSYGAIYSGFAILILFLLWLDLAWLIVLVGAEVAYLHQHPATYLTRVLRRSGSHLFRERLALSTLLEVTRRHLAGDRPWRIADLAADLHAPPSSVEDLAEELVRRRILLRTAEPAGIALARPPEQVRVVDVLEAVRDPGHGAGPAAPSADAVSRLLAHRDEVVRKALDDVTLRILAESATDIQDS